MPVIFGVIMKDLSCTVFLSIILYLSVAVSFFFSSSFLFLKVTSENSYFASWGF